MENKKYEEIINSIIECDQMLEELKAYITELNSAESDPYAPPNPMWEPKANDKFYSVTYGNVINPFWNGSMTDKKALASGMVFKTKEEAEFAVEKQRVIAEMSEWAGKPNTFNEYVIAFIGYVEPYIKVYKAQHGPCGELRFATKEDAQGCIYAVGAERILKYYFGIDIVAAENERRNRE